MTSKFIEIDGKQYQLCPDEKVPKDDPNFPSYENAEYNGVEEDLELVSNIYSGGKSVSCYLPQWEREPKSAYQHRLDRTLFQNFFKPAVNGFPGFLSDIRSTDTLYQGLQDCLEDVDLQGNDFPSFLWQCDLKVIRDGYCGILVDMQRLPRDANGDKVIKTLADQSKVTVRPYLVLVDRRNILSGYESNNRITIREFVNQPVGNFGSQSVTRYRTFFNDGSYALQVILLRDNEPVLMTIEDGVSDLKEIPLILYSATDTNPSCAVPPLLNLAEKNKAHYELYSEYRELIHKVNNPTAVREGIITPGQTDFSNLPPIVLGANTGIDIPAGGRFHFVSPSTDCFVTDRTELDKLEVSMSMDTLKFLTSDSGNKTATEVQMDSSQTQATLSGLATLKESTIEQVAEKWARYYGDKGMGGTCKVNKDLLSMPLSSQDMAVLSNLATQNQLSIITLLEMLQAGKRLPEGITPALEVRRLASQISLRQKLDSESMVLSKLPKSKDSANSLKSNSNQKVINNGNSNDQNQK